MIDWYDSNNKKLKQCHFCRCLVYNYEKHECKHKEDLK